MTRKRTQVSKVSGQTDAEILRGISEAISQWNPHPIALHDPEGFEGPEITPELRRNVHPKKTPELVAGAEKAVGLMVEKLPVLESLAREYGFQENLQYIFQMLRDAAYVNLSAMSMLGEQYWDRWIDFVLPRKNTSGMLFSFRQYLDLWAMRIERDEPMDTPEIADVAARLRRWADSAGTQGLPRCISGAIGALDTASDRVVKLLEVHKHPFAARAKKERKKFLSLAGNFDKQIASAASPEEVERAKQTLHDCRNYAYRLAETLELAVTSLPPWGASAATETAEQTRDGDAAMVGEDWKEFHKGIAREVGKLVVPQPEDDPTVSQRNFKAFQEKLRSFGERDEQHRAAIERAKQLRGELWLRAQKEPSLQVPPANPRKPDASAPKPGWKWDRYYFVDGLPLLAGPRHQMPAKHVPAVADGITKALKAQEAKIRQREREIDRYKQEVERTAGTRDVLKPMETLRKMEQDLAWRRDHLKSDKDKLPKIRAHLRSRYRRLTPTQKKRGWIRIDHYTGKRDKDGNAVITPDDPAVFHTQRYCGWEIPWWRYLGWPEARAFGCWHPVVEIPDSPCEWMIAKTEETNTDVVIKDLPELDEAKELERRYVILASIFDNVSRGGKRITAVWSQELRERVWFRLSKGREHGPTRQYIQNALGYVRADRAKLNNAGSPPAQALQGDDAGTNEPETPPVTLIGFMEQYCTGSYRRSVLRNRKTSLQAACRSPHTTIELPKYVGKWKSGKPKRYRPIDLVAKWPEFLEEVPDLPPLKAEYSVKSA